MPNSRRRKFSVQNDIARRNPAKVGTTGAPSNSLSTGSSTKTNKNKMFPNASIVIEPLEMVMECDENSSISLAKETLDKHVTASSSNIDLHTLPVPEVSESVSKSVEMPPQPEPQPTPRTSKRDTVSMERNRREKPHQHRVRVRSPKHRLLILETPKIQTSKEEVGTGVDVDARIYVDVSTTENPCMETVGINAIDWAQEVPICNTMNARVFDCETIEYDRPSEHSLDDMCRICHGGDRLSPELGRLISACCCRGTVGRVHVRCLERWLTESGKSRCELCGTRYATHRVHRYGVPKALVMWFLSQNAKQLMVDSLGIMLMSPLAVLAAWLSGRTLAGLMTQESQVTPWPLASTFVLACMTLVCYYCWIVSAATRHALGWWIWYRSQYEVRLQMQEEE